MLRKRLLQTALFVKRAIEYMRIARVADGATRRASREIQRVITKIVDDWSTQSDYAPGYGETYRDTHHLQGLINSYAAIIPPLFNNYGKTTGCDFGCWYGFSSLMLSMFGARHVYGVEINTSFVDKANQWVAAYDLKGVDFLPIADSTIDLHDGSVDWVLINQVLCNARAGTFSDSLREAYRILNDDGVLVFCESNNPHCPDTVKRLAKWYRQLEIGSGTPDAPEGGTYHSRANLIRKQAPDLSDQDVRKLAKGTCYLWGQQISAAVETFRNEGTPPESYFDASGLRCPCEPKFGGAQSQVTDPFAIRDDLVDVGFRKIVISTYPMPSPKQPADLKGLLTRSQGFYIYARK